MIEFLTAWFMALSIGGQALAENNTLESVGETRQQGRTEISIPAHVDVSKYNCRLGLPARYGWLIGRELWFFSDDGLLYGPWLVTDIQQVAHDSDPALNMESNNLLADVDCQEMVHKKGKLLVRYR